jgi:hypothetical protein
MRTKYDIHKAHNCAPIINPRCADALLAYYADSNAAIDDGSVPTPTPEQEKAVAAFMRHLANNLQEYREHKARKGV